MGYFRDATPEEVERNELSIAWNWKIPADARDLPFAEQYRRVVEANERIDPKVWVKEPTDDWLTAEELVSEYGYKPEALEDLFGEPADGPDDIRGWTVNHVDHIEGKVITAAVDLLKSSLLPAMLEEKVAPFGQERHHRPTRAEAAEMLKAHYASKRTQESESALHG